MFITELEFKSNIRDLRSEIKALASDLNSDILILNNMLMQQKMLIEDLHEQVRNLESKI